jgi:CubicO group peptidase (beta-lactamase class C family)
MRTMSHRARPAVIAAVVCSVAWSLASCAASDDVAAPASAPTVAAETVPDETVPDETVPDETVPDETVPDETVPDEADDAGRVAASEALFADIDDDAPGCTVAVSRDGEVVWAHAVGAASLDPLEPLTVDSRVDIGSTSKQFTATAIALLVERGGVALDDVVSTYLDGLPAWADEVTVEQLVHHTSGITDYIGLLLEDGIGFADPSDDADALRVLADATELEFEPGDHFEYSNSNYFLLGQVVQAVTGDRLGVFVQDEVFDPLELDMLMDPAAELDDMAVSYEDDGAGGFAVADSPWTQEGDGGIRTTPTELVRWASEYWEPTLGDDPVAVDAMRFDGAVDAGDGDPSSVYGFGMGRFELGGRVVLSHSGGWGGFVTTFVVDPAAHVAVAGTCTAAESVPESDLGDPGIDLLGIWS